LSLKDWLFNVLKYFLKGDKASITNAPKNTAKPAGLGLYCPGRRLIFAFPFFYCCAVSICFFY